MDGQKKLETLFSKDLFRKLMSYKSLDKQRLNSIVEGLINEQLSYDFYYVFKRECMGAFVQIKIHIASNAELSFIFPFSTN